MGNTGTVDESAYNDGEDEILQMFYDEFQKHTKKYKTAVYPFEKFKTEYVRMLSTFATYGTAMGGAFVQSGKADGILDPSQPDTITGPITMAPELGSGKFTEADMPPDDMRKRNMF